MNKRTFTAILVIIGLFVFQLPNTASANPGVSVNTGKIILDNQVVPGGNYDLPSIEVKNIGDVQTNYDVSVEYNDAQSQLKPDASWFKFDPSYFSLMPGQSKIVKINLVVPTNANSGDYFAYIEAHSLRDSSAIGTPTSISGAAATKLYFSIESYNIFKATFFSLLSFTKEHSMWMYSFLVIFSLILIYELLKRIKLLTKGRNNSEV